VVDAGGFERNPTLPHSMSAFRPCECVAAPRHSRNVLESDVAVKLDRGEGHHIRQESPRLEMPRATSRANRGSTRSFYV
jgi:hypothetical protein